MGGSMAVQHALVDCLTSFRFHGRHDTCAFSFKEVRQQIVAHDVHGLHSGDLGAVPCDRTHHLEGVLTETT